MNANEIWHYLKKFPHWDAQMNLRFSLTILWNNRIVKIRERIFLTKLSLYLYKTIATFVYNNSTSNTWSRSINNRKLSGLNKSLIFKFLDENTETKILFMPCYTVYSTICVKSQFKGCAHKLTTFYYG